MNASKSQINGEAFVTDPSLDAEQHLDKIYHAMPAWVRQTWRTLPLWQRMQNGFRRQEFILHREILKHVDTRSFGTEFASYLCKKLGVEFGDAIHEFMLSPEYQEVKKRELAPQLKEEIS